MNIAVVYRLLCNLFFLWCVFTICRYYYVYLILFMVLKLSFHFLEKHVKDWLPVDGKSVLITGCDTGFGNHLANRLADDGFVVFASVLNINSPGAIKLKNRKLQNLHVLQLDVTKSDDITAAVNVVNNKTKQKELWGVVNNTGINIYGDVEHVLMDNYRYIIEANLFGMIAVIKAFLPQIRKSKGRIVNLASVMGRFTLPGNSNYQISKFGVETMSDALRLEMVKFGVGVSIIEPGQFDAATSCSGPELCKRVKRNSETMWSNASEEVKALYGKEYFFLAYQNRKRGEPGSASDPTPVLDTIEDALLNVYPKPRYMIHGGRYFDQFAIMATIYNFLPTFVSDFIINLWTGCYKNPRDRSAHVTIDD